MSRNSIFEPKLAQEDKIDLNYINQKVDNKLKDLLHQPQASKVFENISNDETGAPQIIPQLKEMVENEAYLRDLIMSQAEVYKFNFECDSIEEQTYKIAKAKAEQFENLSKTMEAHNEVMSKYNAKRDELQKMLQKVEAYK